MSMSWIEPDAILDNVIIIDDGAIFIANLETKKAEQLRAQVEQGQALSMSALSNDGLIIPFNTIHKIKYDAHEDYIDVDYKGKKGKDDKNILLESTEIRDQVFNALKAGIGQEFNESTHQQGRIRASLMPVSWIIVFSFSTWLFAKAADQIGAEGTGDRELSGMKALFAAALDFVGSTGILVIGGVLVALYFWYWIRKLRNPPLMTILKRI